MELNSDPLRQSPPDVSLRITIEGAVRGFLQDEEARKLAKTTTCQSKTLFEQQFSPWATGQSLLFLDQLTTAKLREFRASWKNSASTSQRKHHRLNSFFDFCIENEWLTRNPAKKMKAVHATANPTDYLRQQIRNCPPPFEHNEAGHFAQEWGEEIASKALQAFGDDPMRA